jgi:predicted MarR family transcription regulator
MDHAKIKIKDFADKRILELIDRHPDIYPAKLRELLLIYNHEFSHQGLSYRLGQYEKAGWLTREKQTRTVSLRLTRKGRGQLR